MKPSFTPLDPQVVLGVAAHPDDLDYGAGGTLARYARQGAAIHYLILTDGSKGTADRKLAPADLIQRRHAEQQAALNAIGGTGIEFLDYPDGLLEVTMDLKKDICKTIRRLKPDLVITMDPSMLYAAERGFINHPDHRAAGQAALDAVFPLARDHLSFPELCDVGLEPHKTPHVLLVNFTASNFTVDITDSLGAKLAAIAAHTSQQPGMPGAAEKMRELAQQTGAEAGYAYAEAFVRIDVQP